MRIATKGVVELFNTVREFQSNTLKEARQEQKEKDLKYQQAVQAVGTGGGYTNTSNQNIIKKLQEQQPSRWSVLNPDEDGDESDLDSEGNIKIKEYVD